MQQFRWSLTILVCLGFLTRTVFAASPQNPLLTDDAIYVSDEGVYRFNRSDLSLDWAMLSGVQTFAPVISQGLLFVGSSQGLYALDPESGRVLWNIEKSRTIFSPEVSEQLFAGSLHGELYAIDPVRGEINWRVQFDGWIYSPVVMPEQGLLWTGGQAHQAFSIATIDGRRLQSIALNQESVFSPSDIGKQQIAFNLFNGDTAIINSVSAKIDGWLKGSTQPQNLQFDDRIIYRSNRDGSLSAYDRNSYRALWQKTMVERDLTMHPGNAGFILMSDLDRSLILYDLQNQTEAWRRQLPGRWFAPIQADDGEIIYFISSASKPNRVSAVKFFGPVREKFK
ncbi:MAG: PQQ-binding-like beta-propeller repeat protein [Gammaproteobacteria bacterium]